MKKKILIVDDHAEFRKTLKTFLERADLSFLILEADSETSAVKKASSEQPDIVLLELQLPKMNGIKTSKLIKKVSPNSKIIIVSMFNTENFQKKFLGKHIDDFIGKSELDDKLLRLLKKHKKKSLESSANGSKSSVSNPSPEKNEKGSLKKSVCPICTYVWSSKTDSFDKTHSNRILENQSDSLVCPNCSAIKRNFKYRVREILEAGRQSGKA
ncbi:MAG: response regulator [Candidatus Riflebacteria bacterium]|nr:response regulator [Candidatus Riflebacteria bacterium]